MVKQIKGICTFCSSIFAKGGMKRHLESCKERKVESGKSKIFHIVVSAGVYWMHLEVSGSATLKDLDRFLRKIWLECCGHLSAFTIAGVEYLSSPYEQGDKSMNIKLSKIICLEMEFIHEYDFGTTTRLELKVVSERKGRMDDNIEILARNEPPLLMCGKCGQPATQICSECIWESDEKGLLCDKCVMKHECDEDMLLPMLNSPRAGICGYVG